MMPYFIDKLFFLRSCVSKVILLKHFILCTLTLPVETISTSLPMLFHGLSLFSLGCL